MSKVTISDVAKALQDSHIDPPILRRIIEQLNAKVDQAEALAEADRPTRVKTQYVILVSSPTGTFNTTLAGWVLKIEEGGSPSTVLARVEAAAASYHATKKGQLYLAKSIGEVIESVPKKHWGGTDGDTRTQVVTKQPVLVVTTTNALSQTLNTQPRSA